MEPAHDPHASSASRRTDSDFGNALREAQRRAGKASLTRRFLARFVDSVVAGVPSVLFILIAPGSPSTAVLLGMLLGTAYLLVCDGLDVRFMRRRSLGKGLLNLRPERLDGQPMAAESSLRRNGVFAIFYFGVLPGIGWLASLAGLALVAYETYRAVTDPEGRRWGDELAGTKVVETGP